MHNPRILPENIRQSPLKHLSVRNTMESSQRIISVFLFLFALVTGNCDGNLVFNGDFESISDNNTPESWSSAGNASVKQKLYTDIGRDGKHCAKLECFEFKGDGPDFHAMICQVGKVTIKKGEWYRLTFFARGERIRGNVVDVGLSNTRNWENTGLSEAFIVGRDWRKYEFIFQASSDLPAEASRLQFWFKSPGVLWLDDVEIVKIEEGRQWFPQITGDGVINMVPNSSFECDDAGWGSFTYGLSGWAGNLYRLEGEIDNKIAYHGNKSLKIALNQRDLPVFYFDYFTPVAQKVKRVFAANIGWFKVSQDNVMTLSAYIRADADETRGELIVNDPNGRRQSKKVTITKNWQRYEFSFKPTHRYFFIAVGVDLEATGCDTATVWIDAVQLEHGDKATAYQPRTAAESFLISTVPNNISIKPAKGFEAKVVAFNNSESTQKISGKITVTDFFDKPIYEREILLNVQPNSGSSLRLKNLNQGRPGFFRINYSYGNSSNSLRCAVIYPVENAIDSPLGFNHAYPWNFLVKLTHQAGIVWWRDWSAKWDTIEPEPTKVDFSIPDEQIKRVADLNGRVEVLLPFPSARWSTSAKPQEINKAAGNDSYLKARLPLAFMPKNPADFANHAAEVVKHYSHMNDLKPRSISHYQILNEPVYTDYALPRKFGYSLDDYISLLSLAYKRMKDANPGCYVVGGISANLESGLTHDFITHGGLRYLDIFDIHNYDPPRDAESFEESFKTLRELMLANGGGDKPVWITEWGCYADDDPPVIPFTAGDSAMNRSRWQSERAAAEHIVKYVAVSFAYGVRKIFFHAGTCGTINLPDAGGVLYEYGGTPRKMYVASAVLCRLLGVPDECVKVIKNQEIRAYVFRSGKKYIAICWNNADKPQPLFVPSSVQIFDVMGNLIKERKTNLDRSPKYLISSQVKEILKLF